MRDWNSETHDEVVDRHAANKLLQRFLDDVLDYCFAGKNVLDRARDKPKKAPSAGSHQLGNLHLKAPEARRAWLWRDTGELDPLGEGRTVDWMVAQGARRQGERSDLQVTHSDLLFDPDDGWLPTGSDYEDLAVEHNRQWLDRARAAVREAAQEAELSRGEMIEADTEAVATLVGQAADVNISVGQDYSERWVVIDRLDSNKQPVDYEVAFTLAAAACEDIEDDADIEEIFEQDAILDDRVLIEPAKSYAWCGIV